MSSFLKNGKSSEFIPDAVSAGGESPVNVEVGATDSAGAAFQAAFIVDADPVMFQPVHIGRANVKAGLLLAVINTNRAVYNVQMRGFIHIKAVQKEFVFY